MWGVKATSQCPSGLDRTGWQMAPLAKLGSTGKHQLQGNLGGSCEVPLMAARVGDRPGLQTEQEALPPGGSWSQTGAGGYQKEKGHPGRTGSNRGQHLGPEQRPRHLVTSLEEEAREASVQSEEGEAKCIPNMHVGQSQYRGTERTPPEALLRQQEPRRALAGRPPTPPAPAFSQKLLPNSQAAHGPGDRAQTREGKRSILCVPHTAAPFPQLVTILPLFLVKQMVEELMLFELRSSLKKKSQSPGEGARQQAQW